MKTLVIEKHRSNINDPVVVKLNEELAEVCARNADHATAVLTALAWVSVSACKSFGVHPFEFAQNFDSIYENTEEPKVRPGAPTTVIRDAELIAARAALRREQDARAQLRVELDAERAQHRTNVEGFESALAQEQHERSILEVVEQQVRDERDQARRELVAAMQTIEAAAAQPSRADIAATLAVLETPVEGPLSQGDAALFIRYRDAVRVLAAMAAASCLSREDLVDINFARHVVEAHVLPDSVESYVNCSRRALAVLAKLDGEVSRAGA